MISIGFPLGGFRNKKDNTLVDFRGNVVFNGRCSLGKGCKVIVDRGGRLEFGKNFNCTAGLNLECKKSIRFGDNCVLSWDITIIDTDFHPIYDENKNVLNPNKPVVIGNNVWIGYNSNILKGVEIADNVVIASNSVVSKNIIKTGVIVANEGNNQRIIKTNVSWSPIDVR